MVIDGTNNPFEFYPLTEASNPDGTPDNGDETYTVGAEVD